jgi:hypothetical protein
MMVIALLEITPTTRTLDPLFPKATLNGARMQLMVTNPSLRIPAFKNQVRFTDAVLLVPRQNQQLVLHHRRRIPPLDLLLQRWHRQLQRRLMMVIA